MSLFVLNDVRFNFVKVFIPEVNALNGQEEFSVMVDFPNDHPQTEALEAAIQAEIDEVFGPKAKNIRHFVKINDGAKAYVPTGHWYFTAKTRVNNRLPDGGKPRVVDAKKNPITDASGCYSGCRGNIAINIKAYNVNVNKGVTCYLSALQVTEQGENLEASAIDAFGVTDGYTEPEKPADAADAFEDVAPIF